MVCSPVFRDKNFIFSNKLARGFSGLSSAAFVVLDRMGNSPIGFGTDPIQAIDSKKPEQKVRSANDRLVAVDRYHLSIGDQTMFEDVCPDEGGASGRKGRWQTFDCVFENEIRDAIALCIDPSEDVSLVTRMIEKMWPTLREDCVQEYEGQTGVDETFVPNGSKLTGDEALLWMISDRLDIALFVLDAQCRMLRINSAARILLQDERILRRGRGGLFGVTEADTAALRTAVAAQAEQMKDGQTLTDQETVIFLEGSGDKKVPVTLSGFVYKGKPTNCVVAMLPMPPDSRRVEMLGRGMGLTAVEARVASLIQLGLSNREAASRAGIREQTFNTYAKRALSKLNVSCRAEMAQLLTWQAGGGRKS